MLLYNGRRRCTFTSRRSVDALLIPAAQLDWSSGVGWHGKTRQLLVCNMQYRGTAWGLVGQIVSYVDYGIVYMSRALHVDHCTMLMGVLEPQLQHDTPHITRMHRTMHTPESSVEVFAR